MLSAVDFVRLRAALAIRRETQAALARRLGTSPSYLSDVVHERRRLTPALREDLQSALGLQVWDYVTRATDILRGGELVRRDSALLRADVS
jgi:transcriptional regulator with XRE-family HTH domain